MLADAGSIPAASTNNIIERIVHRFEHRADSAPVSIPAPPGPTGVDTPSGQGDRPVEAPRLTARNDLIFDDVLNALEADRSPLVPTARKDHAEHRAERLGRFVRNVLFLRGGMGVNQRRAIMPRLEEIAGTEERDLVAMRRCIASPPSARFTLCPQSPDSRGSRRCRTCASPRPGHRPQPIPRAPGWG